MSRKVRRDASGQFAAGQSGNPDGARLRKPKALLTLTDIHRVVLEVSNETVGHRDGRPVSRLENAARGLAKGESVNRLATKDLVELAKAAAYHFERLERDKSRKDRGW